MTSVEEMRRSLKEISTRINLLFYAARELDIGSASHEDLRNLIRECDRIIVYTHAMRRRWASKILEGEI